MLSETDKLLMKQLAERGSLQSIEHACYGKTLMNSQVLGVVVAMIKKSCIISFDTGLGKTVIAMALINLLTLSGEKALFIVKRNTLDEIFQKDNSMLKPSLKCGYITNESKVIERMVIRRQADSSSLLVVSSDSIANPDVNDYLFKMRERLKVVVVDEMHLFSNLKSVESRFISSIAQKAQYVYALTATPFQRDIDQVINTAYMLRPNLFGGLSPRAVYNKFCVYNNGKLVGYTNLDKLKKVLKPVMINVTREMLGIKVEKTAKIHYVEPKPEWKDLSGNEAFRIIKSATNEQPFYILVQLLAEYIGTGKKGLIYANLNSVKEPILNKLKELGFRIGIVDGSISVKSQRAHTKELFNEGNLDVLIINTPTSADLSCDFIIFYELTLEYSQMVGRACRDFGNKEIFIDFIIAKDTYEEKFFINNVYNRVVRLSQVCDKNVSEIILAVESDLNGK